MKFSLDDLQLFLSIARNGTLAGAARQQGLNHSTVFRRLNALELAMDVRLFERMPYGYVLTPAGELLRIRAERVEDEAWAIEREIAGQDIRLSGHLRVTSTDTLANSFLSPLFNGFHDLYPHIELELLIANGLLDPARGEADVAIRPTASPPEHLVGRKLGTIFWGVYGARGYLEGMPPLESIENPGPHRFIAGNELISHLTSSRWLETRISSSSVALRTNGLVATLGAASVGMGLAVLPHFMARRVPELQCVHTIGPEVTTDLWLLVHPDMRRSARVRAFIDYTVSAMSELQHELSGNQY